MRKKRADMTPMERMDWIMTNATWEDAEAVGVEILAHCMALHCYARKNGEEYFKQLLKRICIRADEWAHEPGNPAVLAFAAAGYRMMQREEQKKSDNDKTEKL